MPTFAPRTPVCVCAANEEVCRGERNRTINSKQNDTKKTRLPRAVSGPKMERGCVNAFGMMEKSSPSRNKGMMDDGTG